MFGIDFKIYIYRGRRKSQTPKEYSGEKLSLPPPSSRFSSVAQRLTLCNPMDCSIPGLPVHHQPSSLSPNLHLPSLTPPPLPTAVLKSVLQYPLPELICA